MTPTTPPTTAETTSAIGATNRAGKRIPEATCPGRVVEIAVTTTTTPRIARNDIPLAAPHRSARLAYRSRSRGDPRRSRPISARDVVTLGGAQDETKRQ